MGRESAVAAGLASDAWSALVALWGDSDESRDAATDAVTALTAAGCFRALDTPPALGEDERAALTREILRRYHREGPQTNETGLSATIRIALDVLTARAHQPETAS